MSYNLFVEHHIALQNPKSYGDVDQLTVGSGWENNFTNILTFFLNCDTEALIYFCNLIFGNGNQKAISVKAQYNSSEGIPDIIINLESGDLLLVECKIDAKLQPYQLQRYLKITSGQGGNTYVALFSKFPIEIPFDVLSNPNYKRPLKNHHYYWTDLYQLIPIININGLGTNTFRYHFKEYMDLVGLSPSKLSDNWSKLYEDRANDDNRRVMIEFGRKLSNISSWLRNQKYKVTTTSYMGLQARPEQNGIRKPPIHFIVIGPARSRKDLIDRKYAVNIDMEVLRIGLVFDDINISHLLKLQYQFPSPYIDSLNHKWWLTPPYEISNHRMRVEFISNLSLFVNKEVEIENHLTIGCQSVIKFILENF